MTEIPTFLILGAAKSGTSSLHRYLREHPDIYMSDPKEPFFFEAEYEKGLDFYRRRYFRGWRGESVSGEARHRNLFLPYVPARIARSLPDARFIVLVREPVERALSHYWHWYARGRETLSFEAALMENLERLWRGPSFQEEGEVRDYVRTLGPDGWSPYRTYIDSGYYAEQIERYINLFGRDRLKIIVFEEFIMDPQGMLDEIWPFLGVRSFRLKHYPAVNRSLSPFGHRLLALGRVATTHITVPAAVKERVGPFLQRIAPGLPQMQPDTYAYLRAHYAPHVRRLEELLSRSFEGWPSAGHQVWKSPP